MEDERETWNELYRSGEFSPDSDPSPLLRAYLDALPGDRALDLATGNGRNALFLAKNGYRVDAIDIADEAIARGRAAAEERSLDVRFVHADLDEYDFPEEAYDVVVASQYYKLDRITDVKLALAPDGVLLWEHHLRSASPVDVGPGTERHRFGSNELLRACLDLTILHYEERSFEREGRTGAKATLVARKSTGPRQSYPRPGPIGE